MFVCFNARKWPKQFTVRGIASDAKAQPGPLPIYFVANGLQQLTSQQHVFMRHVPELRKDLMY